MYSINQLPVSAVYEALVSAVKPLGLLNSHPNNIRIGSRNPDVLDAACLLQLTPIVLSDFCEPNVFQSEVMDIPYPNAAHLTATNIIVKQYVDS